jgi:hypothetical protein
MALSAAARAALEQFKSQQSAGAPLTESLDDELDGLNVDGHGDGSSLPTLPNGHTPIGGVARRPFPTTALPT